jgi:hypothetical protein
MLGENATPITKKKAKCGTSFWVYRVVVHLSPKTQKKYYIKIEN